ncbi:CBP80/20-dependent translation initiation factor isoform X2 [Paroedura picta]|uniref:CBP80/20-dependent translation initiation factor isoform X2 n=1 Tax=Paroedura picta TaxID=143630 RepID=UPI0040563BD5
MENSSAASASSEAGSSRSQEIEELERFIDSYVLEYQVQGLLTDKTEGDGESEKTPSNVSQWTADCNEQVESSVSTSRGKGSAPHNQTQEEWDHSSSSSSGSWPSSGVKQGSGGRGRSSQFRHSHKNGNKDGSLDMLGTDIWAANTLESFSGATWDLQPEKLDFTQFQRKLHNAPKHALPHIDREGIGKGKCEDGDSINLNDIEKVLPAWPGYHPLPNEAEIAHTKKLFRRRRNDRRRQRAPGGNKSQQHPEHPQGTAKHNREHQKPSQGNQAPHSSGRPGHHGYSQNRRWHHNQKHSPNDKETHRNAKETENLKIEDASVCTVHIPLEMHRSNDVTERHSPQYIQELEGKRKDSLHERISERPKINLLQSSKDRLRRRLKEKDEVAVESTNPQKNKMDKLIEILNSMRNNSSGVDSKLTNFMEEAQNSTNSEEMLGEIVRTIYQKAVTDRSFASTAAKLCDKMALFMVEGTKFRSLLLNTLQALQIRSPAALTERLYEARRAAAERRGALAGLHHLPLRGVRHHEEQHGGALPSPRLPHLYLPQGVVAISGHKGRRRPVLFHGAAKHRPASGGAAARDDDRAAGDRPGQDAVPLGVHADPVPPPRGHRAARQQLEPADAHHHTVLQQDNPETDGLKGRRGMRESQKEDTHFKKAKIYPAGGRGGGERRIREGTEPRRVLRRDRETLSDVLPEKTNPSML